MIKALLTSILLLIAFTAVSEAENILTTDANGRIQARLQNETLEEVSGFFRQNFNIKFIGDDELFQTQVTVAFDNLSLEKALKKIFAKTNVAFKYDNQGKITEARLLPTSKVKYNPAVANTFANANKQAPSIDQQDSNDQPPEENLVPEDDSILKDSVTDSTDTGLEIEPNSPSPDDSTEADPDAPSGEPSEGN